MKTPPILWMWIVASALVAVAANSQARAKYHAQQDSATPAAPSTARGSSHADTLERVLQSMDESAAKFRTAQANFSWTPYNSVINETEAPDQGKTYFRL